MIHDIKTSTDEKLESKCPFEFFYQYSKISEYKIRTHIMEKPWSGQLHFKNIWIWGPVGVGKSCWANNLVPSSSIYHKNINKWWDGYQFDAHKLVLIEDWPTDKSPLAQQVKVWGDHYQFIGEAKGSHLTIDPGPFFIVITSNFKPSDCFQEGDVNAITRRFQRIYMNENTLLLFTSVDSLILTTFNKESLWIFSSIFTCKDVTWQLPWRLQTFISVIRSNCPRKA